MLVPEIIKSFDYVHCCGGPRCTYLRGGIKIFESFWSFTCKMPHGLLLPEGVGVGGVAAACRMKP